MADGYYYLHTSGDLIFKKFEPEHDSTFVKRIWEVDITNRINAWTIILEGLGLGANLSRVKDLAQQWSCDVEDLVSYMAYANPSLTAACGLRIFLKEIVEVDVDAWLDWVTSEPSGQFPDLATMPR